MFDVSHKRRSRNIFQPWRFTKSWILHVTFNTPPPPPNKSQAYACTFNVSPNLVVANKLTPKMPQDFFLIASHASIKWQGPPKLRVNTTQFQRNCPNQRPSVSGCTIWAAKEESATRSSASVVTSGGPWRFCSWPWDSHLTHQTSWFTKPPQKIKCPWFQRFEKINSLVHSCYISKYFHRGPQHFVDSQNFLTWPKSNWRILTPKKGYPKVKESGMIKKDSQ